MARYALVLRKAISFSTRLTTNSFALSKLAGLASPVPARSSAVPWSIELQMMDSPSVTLSAASKLLYFNAGKP